MGRGTKSRRDFRTSGKARTFETSKFLGGVTLSIFGMPGLVDSRRFRRQIMCSSPANLLEEFKLPDPSLLNSVDSSQNPRRSKPGFGKFRDIFAFDPMDRSQVVDSLRRFMPLLSMNDLKITKGAAPPNSPVPVPRRKNRQSLKQRRRRDLLRMDKPLLFLSEMDVLQLFSALLRLLLQNLSGLFLAFFEEFLPDTFLGDLVAIRRLTNLRTQLSLSANSSTSLAWPVQVSGALALDRAIHLMETWPLLRIEHFAQNLGKLLTWWDSRTHRCGIRDNFWHIVTRNAVFLPQVMFSPCAMDFRFVFDVAKNLISANITSPPLFNIRGQINRRNSSNLCRTQAFNLTGTISTPPTFVNTAMRGVTFRGGPKKERKKKTHAQGDGKQDRRPSGRTG